jgi:DNA-binding NarL/FixJ family response regulator
MAARTVVLAVNPDVMPQVQKLLAGTLHLGEPIAGEEGLRVHPLGAQHLPPLRVPVRVPECTPAEAAERMGMSRRVLQTLEFLADGLPVKQIASRMGIAPASAKTHTARLYRFLGVNGAPAAVAEGFRLGLLTGGDL